MNRLQITRIASLPSTAAEVPAMLDSLNVSFQPIASVNWPEQYPYCPDVVFRVAWCPEGLVLHYRVSEQSVRAVYGEDDGCVWTDSCVECFIRNADSETYYNIECNCVGTMLIGVGTAIKSERSRLPLAVVGEVKRWASLGKEPFGNRAEATDWEIALVVPTSVFAKSPIRLEAGAILRVNFYKCGDELPVPHFVSWNPVNVPSPNFHRPEFFGEMKLL